MNNLEYRLLYTIYNYYLYLYDIDVNLVNANNKKMNIKFKEKEFIKFIGLGDYFKNKNGGPCNDIDVIIRNINYGMIDPKDYDFFNHKCDLLNKMLKLDLSTSKYIVSDEDKQYLMVSVNNHTVLPELANKGKNKYEIVDIHPVSIIRDKSVNVIPIKKYSYDVLGGKPYNFMDDCGTMFVRKREDVLPSLKVC